MHRQADGKIPVVDVSAANKQDGTIVIALANTSLEKAQDVELALDNATLKTATGRVLTGKKVDDYNDFEHPDVVKTTDFKNIKLKKNTVKMTIPAMSVVVVNLK